jgi:hypothetical protein
MKVRMDQPHDRAPNTTAMSYQVYFADLTEENKSLILTLLRLKAESGRMEPNEREMLTRLGGNESPPPHDHMVSRRGSGNRRGPSNARTTNDQSAPPPPLIEETPQPQPTDD